MVDAAAIAESVYRSIVEIATALRPDVEIAMRAALQRERSERGRRVLETLIANAEAAREDGVPLCQDTGTVWVRVELGAGELPRDDLQEAVDGAVARAFLDRGLRMSVVRDALLDRANTGDNTPAFVELVTRPGFGAVVSVMLKGGGSDNASAVFMLDPSAGMPGVRDAVLATVEAKAAGACPPLVVGVGVGATFDKVSSLSKRALLLPVDERAEGVLGEFEAELLEAVNATGIGPGGLGGDTTALAVRVLTAPCHIAALPVAVNLGCCAVRSITVELA
jgi:tartrate/fumarate subfamily iron-sulfur-dependent hydro-lyase alpha chain